MATITQDYLAPAKSAAVRQQTWPSVRTFERITTLVEIFLDFLVVELAVGASFLAYEALHIGRQIHYTPLIITVTSMAFAALFVLLLDRDGAYKSVNSLLRIKETERTLRVSVQGFAFVSPIALVAGHLFSRWVFALAVVLVPAAVIIQKQIAFALIRRLHEKGYGVQRVVIYGAGYSGRRAFSALKRSPKLGLSPTAFVDDDRVRAGSQIYDFDYTRENSLEVMHGPLTRDLLEQLDADMVVIAIPTISHDRFLRVYLECQAAGVTVTSVPNQAISSDQFNEYIDMDGFFLQTIGAPKSKDLYDVSKRAFDIVAATAILLMVSPVFAVLSLLIPRDSAGPVLFRQKRVGRNGKLFEVLKFRSMRTDAPAYAVSPDKSHDPRITRLGRFLRKSSLDELPQLINVLRGDMSLVGPRPEMPFIVEGYNDRERRRLDVKPGITGLWQISADRNFPIHENLLYDLYYVRFRNFFMDLAILLHTAVFAMRGI
jgi:exopolysaccharide biosynthesis polyprenyl glycosylphosphotransferase